jgi:plastocyanin
MPLSPKRKEGTTMRTIVMLGIALAVGSFALPGAVSVEADTAQVAIHTGGVKDQVTTIRTGDEVTWINASGTPVIHLDFESPPETHPYHMLFTTSTTLQFSRPGTYPYTVYIGGQALAHRGKIVVK